MLKPATAPRESLIPGTSSQVRREHRKVTCSNQSVESKKKRHKVVYYLGFTKYSIVSKVCASIPNWVQCFDENDDWDLCWTDSAVSPEQFSQMKPYQKINHFVGTNAISRKNYLARNMQRMKAYYPNEYKFFPPTWSLPADLALFRSQFTGKRRKTFIIKPDASSQGRGIFLTRNIENIDPSEHLVAQRYIHNPFLIDGLKFDLRVYVLLSGCDPLRIFVHQDGLVRFATKAYAKPTGRNLADKTMHLTNYAINKSASNFEQNCDPGNPSLGHKRSMFHVLDRLRNEGHDVDALCKTIDECLCKTIIGIQPSLAHIYGSCKGEDLSNSMCFEILGIDVMIDHKMTPWLIEVNHSPSFTTDSELDKMVKFRVIRDALVLLGVTPDARSKYHAQQRLLAEQRRLPNSNKQTREQRMLNRQQIMAELAKRRTAWEDAHLGGWRRIYPTAERIRRYSHLVEAAQEIWQCMTGMCKTKAVLARLVAERRVTQKSECTEAVSVKIDDDKCTKADSASGRSLNLSGPSAETQSTVGVQRKLERRTTKVTPGARCSGVKAPQGRRMSSSSGALPTSSSSTISTMCSTSTELQQAYPSIASNSRRRPGEESCGIASEVLCGGGESKGRTEPELSVDDKCAPSQICVGNRLEEVLTIAPSEKIFPVREMDALQPLECLLAQSSRPTRLENLQVRPKRVASVNITNKVPSRSNADKAPGKHHFFSSHRKGYEIRNYSGRSRARNSLSVLRANGRNVDKKSCIGTVYRSALRAPQKLNLKGSCTTSAIQPSECSVLRLKVIDMSALCGLPAQPF